MNSEYYDSFVPVYDVVPETWEDGRQFLVEHLRKISNAVNARVNGFFIDTEVLAGKSFIPGAPDQQGTQPQFRTVLRKVIITQPLNPGANSFAHGIVVDANFTLIDMWTAATRSATPIAQVITDSNVTIDATNININSPGTFDRGYTIVEYIQEI